MEELFKMVNKHVYNRELIIDGKTFIELVIEDYLTVMPLTYLGYETGKNKKRVHMAKSMA